MVDDLVDETGPIDYFVVEFPGTRLRGEALPLLIDLAERGIIRILDLAFVAKDLDGTITGLELDQLDPDGDVDLTVFQIESPGLLGDDDLDEVTEGLAPGNAAGVLIYENTWAGPFAAAMRRAGGQLVAGGRLPVQAILAALDAAEDE